MKHKLLISLFDHSGNISRPYSENEWHVIQVDIKLEMDILSWDYKKIITDYPDTDYEIGILAQPPCTDYALCGAKWFSEKDKDGSTDFSNSLVEKTKEIIQFFKETGMLKFWALENPASRIHKINTWLGVPLLKFQPFWYAGYDPDPSKSQYGKYTWLWGEFNIPLKKEMPCLLDGMKRHSQWGGKSEKTKELRSITPMGFAYAFYEANH